MPRNPLPHPTPPPCCPPWRAASWKKLIENHKRTFSIYRKYRALLAKERRRRAVAETKANRNARKACKLERRLAKILDEIATSEPAKSDPYCKIELEHCAS